MPVEHRHTIKAGASGQLFFVYAADERDSHLPKPGLSRAAADAIVAYVRDGEPSVHRLRLSSGRLGEWSPGSFTEVDPHLMPGVYQFGAPDEMLAVGSTRVMLCMRLPGAVVEPVEVSLVA